VLKRSMMLATLVMVPTFDVNADFQWQAVGAISRNNIDLGPADGDVDSAVLGGRYYLEEVDTSHGPLAEAVFNSQASFVGANWVYTDADDLVDDLDSDAYTLEGRYVWQTSMPLIFEGSWTRETPNFSDIDTYTLGFGAYISPHTEVIFSYRNSDIDDSDAPEVGELGFANIDAYGIDFQHHWELSHDGTFVLSAGYARIDVEDGEDIDSWRVGSNWFVNRTLGFGVEFSRDDNSGAQQDTYSAGVNWFVTDTIGLVLAYVYSEIDNTDIESDQILLGAELRF